MHPRNPPALAIARDPRTAVTADHDRTMSSRLVARHISELLIASAGRWNALIPQGRTLGVVFSVVLSAGVAHLPWREPGGGRWLGIVEAGPDGRPVSAAAIAHSMNLSETTVRRSAAILIEAGSLVRDAAGYRVAPSFLADPRVAEIEIAEAADIVRVLSILAASGHAPARNALSAGVAALPSGIVERVLLAFALRALETFIELYGDLTSGAIVAAIIAANVHHITGDPELARRYAAEDEPPPDAQRRPITLRALSRMINLPFETIRRRVQNLIAADVITSLEGGLIVPTRVLLDNAHLENNRRIVLHFDQMIHTLISLAADGIP